MKLEAEQTAHIRRSKTMQGCCEKGYP